MHTHFADKFVFNFEGKSKLWDEGGHTVTVGDMQTFFAPFLLPHAGGLVDDTAMLIMSIVSPQRELGADPNQPH